MKILLTNLGTEPVNLRDGPKYDWNFILWIPTRQKNERQKAKFEFELRM